MKYISKKMKHFCVMALAVLSMTALVACQTPAAPVQETVAETKASSTETVAQKKKVAVTTSFLADMVKEIAGDKVDIALIIPAGGDPHIYEPQVSDKEKISSADLVLYHGLHFEGKMQEILEHKGVALSKDFPAEAILKMEEDGEEVTDPHFWFDISLYIKATEAAGESLVKLLPEEKEYLEAQTQAYVKKLKDLDAEIRKTLEVLPKEKRYLVTPHDAFFYFARTYGFEVFAPQGVSTEAEADVKSIKETVDFIVNNKIKAIFAESTTNPENMLKLIDEAKRQNQEVKLVSGEGQELFSDSLAPQGEFGDNYIDMYRHNIKLIVENLK